MKTLILKDTQTGRIRESVVSENQWENKETAIEIRKGNFARLLVKEEMQKQGIEFEMNVPKKENKRKEFFLKSEKRAGLIEFVSIENREHFKKQDTKKVEKKENQKMEKIVLKNIETGELGETGNHWPIRIGKEKIAKNGVKSFAFQRVRKLWVENKKFPREFVNEEKALIDLDENIKEAFAKEVAEEEKKWEFVEFR